MRRALVLAAVLAAGCSPSGAPLSPTGDRWVLTGTRLYAGPDVPPIDSAWVAVNGTTIEAVGAAPASPPAGVRVDAACSGGVVTAGFHNSHVHFTGTAFDNAATRPALALEPPLSDMVTSHGFTTVVDTGSLVDNTVALRQRIEAGDVNGPAILTAGIPLYPENGIPIYLRDLPQSLLEQLPQPSNATEAVDIVRRNFARGANGTKIFAVTPVGRGEVRPMSPDVARAAAAEAHARGGLVMAHPTSADGVAAAVAAGADIIVHTTIDGSNAAWSPALIQEMRARNVSLVPTLKLWRYELDKEKVPPSVQEKLIGAARAQLKAFADAGGQVLFGTDAGYMADFDPAEEYTQMAGAGLSTMQILASLTTAPAARWNRAARRGRVQAGFDADLVVLRGDPGPDARQFADVRCTIRGGRQIFRAL